MALTTAQLATLKADIATNQAANLAARDATAIAAFYNAPGTGLIWRPSIPVSELNTAIVWSEFTILTSLLQQAYMAMITAGAVDATSANVRAGFGTVFAGKTSLTNLTNLAQRVPTRFEQLFAVGGVTPVFGQQLSKDDIAAASFNADGSLK